MNAKQLQADIDRWHAANASQLSQNIVDVSAQSIVIRLHQLMLQRLTVAAWIVALMAVLILLLEIR